MRTLFMALNFAAKVVKNIEIRKDLNKNLYKPVIFFIRIYTSLGCGLYKKCEWERLENGKNLYKL